MKPDGECPHARQRYHNWMVYEHNSDWTMLGCFCSRCRALCRMSDKDYIEVQLAAKRAWDAYIARSKR